MTVAEAYRWRGLAMQTAWARLRHCQDAEDVGQDVYLRLIEQDSLDGRKGSIPTLIKTIADRRAVDVYRTRNLHWGRGSGRRNRTATPPARRSRPMLTYVRSCDFDTVTSDE